MAVRSYLSVSPLSLSFLCRTLRRTPVPKGLVVTGGLSAEAPTSYRPRWTEPSMMRGTQEKQAPVLTFSFSPNFEHLSSLWFWWLLSTWIMLDLLATIPVWLLYWTVCSKQGLFAVFHCYMLIWLMVLFLASGLRAAWCPLPWQKPVVQWQETLLWVKIMLLLACTTYLTNT